MALTQENVTTRFNVIGTADFRLVPLAGGAAGRWPARCARSPATARPTSETASAFASRAAERDAERRLARRRSPTRSCSGWRSAAGGLGAVKLAGRDAARFLARPDPGAAGALLYGADAMRVALKRAALVEALIGPDGAAEMRLTRIAGAELRRDPAALVDAVKATGFFPGPRVVLVEEAGDAAAPAVARRARRLARRATRRIVVTAGALGAGSALRKAFEAARSAVAIGIYADPPGRDEIEAALAARRARARPTATAMADIEALAQALDPGDFAQFLEKLALYKRGDPAPLAARGRRRLRAAGRRGRGRRACVDLAADGDAGRARRGVPPARRPRRQPDALTIAAGRYFRTLHAAACAARRRRGGARPRPAAGLRAAARAHGGAGARARRGASSRRRSR